MMRPLHVGIRVKTRGLAKWPAIKVIMSLAPYTTWSDHRAHGWHSSSFPVPRSSLTALLPPFPAFASPSVVSRPLFARRRSILPLSPVALLHAVCVVSFDTNSEARYSWDNQKASRIRRNFWNSRRCIVFSPLSATKTWQRWNCVPVSLVLAPSPTLYRTSLPCLSAFSRSSCHEGRKFSHPVFLPLSARFLPSLSLVAFDLLFLIPELLTCPTRVNNEFLAEL